MIMEVLQAERFNPVHFISLVVLDRHLLNHGSKFGTHTYTALLDLKKHVMDEVLLLKSEVVQLLILVVEYQVAIEGSLLTLEIIVVIIKWTEWTLQLMVLLFKSLAVSVFWN